MSRDMRPRLPRCPIFFTVTLARRGGSLLVDHIGLLRAAVAQTRAERPFGIAAWVVLPDHLHCIWTLPQGDTDYSTRWRLIKMRFTRAVREVDGGKVEWSPVLRSSSKVAKGDAGLWQRRFWEHHIRDAADMTARLRNCWWNLAKHGFVKRPEDWSYSSVHREIAAGRYDPTREVKLRS